MADLKLCFGDVYKEVSRFLGWGISPSGQNLTDAKAITHAGYRKFLYPINAQTGKQHLWSFLLKNTTLLLEGSRWQYPLPTDFDRVYTRFTYDTDDQYMALRKVSGSEILSRRAGVESQGAPCYYAIQPGLYSAEHGQNYEVWFYETPSQSWELHYAYVIRPPQLVSDTDYFIGGDFASEAILESALAVAELRWDGTQSVHTAEANKLMQQLLLSDTVVRPDYHGILYDPAILPKYYQRPLPDVDDAYSE